MTNKYANLDGTKKIEDEFSKINTGFDGVDADIKDLAGTGRTTQTVKKNADDIATHVNEKATDDVHGILSYLGKFATFGRTAAQNLSNAVDTPIVWQTITNSNGAAFCEIDGSGKIKILEKGVYELTANFQYASNATGIRTVDMTSVVAKTVFQAINGTGYLSAHGFAQFNAGDLLTIQAYQSSGAALDLQFQNTRVRIRQVAKLP